MSEVDIMKFSVTVKIEGYIEINDYDKRERIKVVRK